MIRFVIPDLIRIPLVLCAKKAAGPRLKAGVTTSINGPYDVSS
jgi:hypothetical protein